MFGKKDIDTLHNQKGRSFVGESMQIEGDLDYSGAVDVAGLINGNVHVKEMIIFDTGSVKGNLHVSKLNINGHVEGQIIADEISLGSSSVIKGDFSFKSYLKTEEGADIDGYIKRVNNGKSNSEEDIAIEEIVERVEAIKPKPAQVAQRKEAVKVVISYINFNKYIT